MKCSGNANCECDKCITYDAKVVKTGMAHPTGPYRTKRANELFARILHEPVSSSGKTHAW